MIDYKSSFFDGISFIKKKIFKIKFYHMSTQTAVTSYLQTGLNS
jgi:hypothetical protein